MNEPLPLLYAVALHGCASLSVHTRIAAEVRYCDALEHRLGSSDEIVRMLRAVSRLAIDDAGINADLDAEDRQLVARWLSATEAARQAGLDGLDDVQDAWFDACLLGHA